MHFGDLRRGLSEKTKRWNSDRTSNLIRPSIWRCVSLGRECFMRDGWANIREREKKHAYFIRYCMASFRRHRHHTITIVSVPTSSNHLHHNQKYLFISSYWSFVWNRKTNSLSLINVWRLFHVNTFIQNNQLLHLFMSLVVNLEIKCYKIENCVLIIIAVILHAYGRQNSLFEIFIFLYFCIQ